MQHIQFESMTIIHTLVALKSRNNLFNKTKNQFLLAENQTTFSYFFTHGDVYTETRK